jgi:hypothetical protein
MCREKGARCRDTSCDCQPFLVPRHGSSIARVPTSAKFPTSAYLFLRSLTDSSLDLLEERWLVSPSYSNNAATSIQLPEVDSKQMSNYQKLLFYIPGKSGGSFNRKGWSRISSGEVLAQDLVNVVSHV